ncbi:MULTISPECIES: WYL domain-containing protein [Gammaproteobacteria]|jgi:predicted DNA-binding transcriptional regulator YafY|uniref:helix-turn-helix transcriptional regulator n=1 Tax=Gammaproteobacteria TaxID=1236 RepID=UPI0030DCFAB5
MPASASISNKTFRMLALLHALPRAPRKATSAELQEKLANDGHEISKRSVERYLEELSASHEFGAMLRCDDASQPYGWSVHSERNLSIPGMDAQMAATWDLVHRYLKPLMAKDALEKLDPVFREARSWFDKHRPIGKRYWSDKVAYVPRGFALQPARVAPGIADLVYDALHRNRQMDVWYKDNSEPQRVHPYALVDRGAVRYLVVRFWQYEDYRHLALQRLRKVRVLDDEVDRAVDFDLDRYLRDSQMNLPYGETIEVVLNFKGRAGDHLYETPINASQSLQKLDDGTLLTTHLEHTQELVWWILGFGASVEVLEPQGLREEVADEVLRAQKLYKK